MVTQQGPIIRKRILGLDLGTITGWAVILQSHGVQFGQFDVSRKDDCRADRIQAFSGAVGELLSRFNPEEIWYEFTVQRGEASRWFSAWEALLLLEVGKADIPCFSVNALTLKKWCTGSGRAPKDDMVVAAKAFIAMHPNVPHFTGRSVRPTYDEADAICVLSYALERR